MTPPDDHEVSILEMIRELADMEFKRGQLMVRLEWHLRMQALSRQLRHTPSAPLPASDSPDIPVASPPTGKSRWERGVLEEKMTALMVVGPRTIAELAQEMDANPESVRVAMYRLLKKGVARKAEHRRYALDPELIHDRCVTKKE